MTVCRGAAPFGACQAQAGGRDANAWQPHRGSCVAPRGQTQSFHQGNVLPGDLHDHVITE